MNLVKLNLVKMIAIGALAFCFSISVQAQEIKIGVVNISALMEQANALGRVDVIAFRCHIICQPSE